MGRKTTGSQDGSGPPFSRERGNEGEVGRAGDAPMRKQDPLTDGAGGLSHAPPRLRSSRSSPRSLPASPPSPPGSSLPVEVAAGLASYSAPFFLSSLFPFPPSGPRAAGLLSPFSTVASEPLRALLSPP